MECRVHSPCGGFTVRFVFSAGQQQQQGRILLQVQAKRDHSVLAHTDFVATLTPETVAHITADAGVTKTLPHFADMLYAAFVGKPNATTALNFSICTLGDAVLKLQGEEGGGGGGGHSHPPQEGGSPVNPNPAVGGGGVKKDSVLSSTQSHPPDVSSQLILLLEYNVAFTRAWYAVPLQPTPRSSSSTSVSPRKQGVNASSSASASPTGIASTTQHQQQGVSPDPTRVSHHHEVVSPTGGPGSIPRVVLGSHTPPHQQSSNQQPQPQRGQQLTEKENFQHQQQSHHSQQQQQQVGGGGGKPLHQHQDQHEGSDQMLISEIKRLKKENHALKVGTERELKEVIKQCERLKRDYQEAHRWKDDAHHYKKRCSDLEREISRLRSVGGGRSGSGSTPMHGGSSSRYSSSPSRLQQTSTPPRGRTSGGGLQSSNRYNSPRSGGGGATGASGRVSPSTRGGSPSRYGYDGAGGRYNNNNKNRYDSGDDRSSNGSFGHRSSGSRGRYDSPTSASRQNYRVSPTKRSSTPPRGVWR